MDKGRKLRAGDPPTDGFLEVSSSPRPVFSTPLGWVTSAVLWGLRKVCQILLAKGERRVFSLARPRLT